MSIPIEVELKAKGGIKIEGAGGDAGGGGAVGGNAAGMVGAVAKGVVIAQLALGALRGIADNMVKSSGALQGVFKMFEMAMLILFKPLGDFLATLLRPVAIALLYFVFSFAKILQKELTALGELLGGLLAPIAEFLKSLVAETGTSTTETTSSRNILEKITIESIATQAQGLIEQVGSLFALLGKTIWDFVAPRIAIWADAAWTVINGVAKILISVIGGVLFGVVAFFGAVWDFLTGNFADGYLKIGLGLGIVMKALGEFLDGWIAVMQGLSVFLVSIVSPELSKQVNEWFNSVRDTLSAFFDGIRDWFFEMGLQAGQQAQSAADGIASALDSGFKAIQKAIKSLLDWVKKQIDKLKDAASSVGEALGFGGKQVGSGYIPSDGLYYLHRGENVVSNTQKGMGATTVNNSISINATVSNDYDVDRLAEELQRKMNEKMWRNSTYTNSYI